MRLKKFSLLTLACACCIGGGALLFFWLQNDEEELLLPSSLTSSEKTAPGIPIEASLAALFGAPQEESYAVQRVREEVRYMGPVDRPGDSKERVWICLREGESPRQAGIGETIPLEFDPGSSQLRMKWSYADSPLMLRIAETTPQGLRTEVELSGIGSFPLVLKGQEASRQKAWDIAGNVVDGKLLLKMEGRWFGQDQLSSELVLQGKGVAQHLEFGFGARCYALAIPMGETLSYVDGKWRAGCYANAPVVRLDSWDAQRLILKIWDASGVFRTDLQMPRVNSGGDLGSLAAQFRLKSLRGQRRAILQVGSQSFICKEGDWLVKKGEVWQHLPSPTSRASWIETHGVGEVAVIQRIRRARGKPQVEMKVFNAVHTEGQSATLFPSGTVLSCAPRGIQQGDLS